MLTEFISNFCGHGRHLKVYTSNREVLD